MSKKNPPIKIPPLKRRNLLALKAMQRHAGPMKDRRTPRSGALNRMQEYMDLAEEEE